MGRQSGFLTSLAVALLAALSVSILERRSDGSSQIRLETRDQAVQWSPPRDCSPGEISRSFDDLQPGGLREPDSAIGFAVPANSTVIVGSLDVSGAAHSLVIRSECLEMRATSTSLTSRNHLDLEYINATTLADLRRKLTRPESRQPDRSRSEVSRRDHRSDDVRLLCNQPTRPFLIPHFECNQVVQHPCEASPIAEGLRVKVYLDLCMAGDHSDVSQQQLQEEAKRVCTAIEFELLPQIEHWVGPVTDLDGDQRLSVVLTDLDRRKDSTETPILGCVRRSDFTPDSQNSLAGDIVYLDRHLPPREELSALLAHELTHAAIFCICHEAPNNSPLKNHSVPSWLNEAAAHWVERLFCATPTGFGAREVAFRRSPGQCPIIISDDNPNLTARRTGSRVAGFTFLQQHLRDVRDLRVLLEECGTFQQSIAAIAEAPFSQLFREWTISQTCGDFTAFSPQNSAVNSASLQASRSQPVRHKLHGTAFLILQAESDQSVVIEAHDDAQLQITVLHQVNSVSTQLPSQLTITGGQQTAALESLSHNAIQ